MYGPWTLVLSVIIKYSPLGEKLMTITVGERPDNGSPFDGTTDIAFGPNGRLYITDGYGNARILEYTPDGTRVKQWGKPGTGPGEFSLPHAIQIDEKGTVYVADLGKTAGSRSSTSTEISSARFPTLDGSIR